MPKVLIFAIIVFALFVCSSRDVFAQTTEFTYQGSLKNSGVPANANYDFEFALFDMVSGGAQVGSTLQKSNVAVANGIFSVNLDFGPAFPGAIRYLEIRVRPTGGGAFTPLTPRQSVSSSPYSVKSLNSDTAASATNAAQLGGVAAGKFIQSDDARLSDDRVPLPGSTNYIQNGSSPQTPSNFNVSGIGTASVFNAGTQYNIGGSRVLSVAGNQNVFAGAAAGFSNTTGESNSFFGQLSGQNNTSGQSNAFFGRASGISNSTGSSNAFFGSGAGFSNTTANLNSFYGHNAGFSNMTGILNAFFGEGSGFSNTTGQRNSFIGQDAGANNTVGDRNVFVGNNAGSGNISGGQLTMIGDGATPISTTLTNATAIGANAAVTQSNSLVLGSIAGVAGGAANTNVGIGTSAPQAALHVNNGSIRLTGGGIYVANPNTLIITSPNGACWGITVNNAGALATFPVTPCP